MKTLLALGCSHTAGVGVAADQCYVNILAQQLGLRLENLAVPGGNHSQVQQNLCRYIKQHSADLIIAQWPHPYRMSVWHNNKMSLENINAASDVFHCMLRAGTENFIEPWINSIVVTNLLCQAKSIPVINILLETQDQYIHQRLAEFDIVLHQDDKLPGKTWFFDSAAQDGLHHSAACHARWAQRILEILNEPTSR